MFRHHGHGLRGDGGCSQSTKWGLGVTPMLHNPPRTGRETESVKSKRPGARAGQLDTQQCAWGTRTGTEREKTERDRDKVRDRAEETKTRRDTHVNSAPRSSLPRAMQIHLQPAWTRGTRGDPGPRLPSPRQDQVPGGEPLCRWEVGAGDPSPARRRAQQVPHTPALSVRVPG